ncbi:pimeloyl-ACP methyl ester carboxylesterase [Deinococcus sp. HSC-46F16]|uniref:alpha/beta fold hydrolase n=1 Tax=Deinococcus sp. HSC-46F16 TaxID=2910968 RepID=UPI0020A1B84A|nr:alpha/beta hydrolase [Deinococcus sp. HSC-46F16]MCP2015854.1 pimeloyl-ACP methyl ester carboxylesterase [Deinococcus sp. HSC-46F16]
MRRRWLWVGGLALGAVLTALRIRHHERRYPPRGRVLDLADGPTHIIEGGSPGAPPVVLIHGSDGVALDWPVSPLWNALAPHARLIAPDRPGHGHTPARPGTPVTVEVNVRRLAAVLDALEVRQPVLLLGHSYGAAVALAFAAQFPERVRGLVLVSPTAYPVPGLTRPLAYVPLVPVLETLLTRVLLLPLGRAVAWLEGGRAFHPAPIPPEWHAMMLAFSRRRGQVHALAWENRTLAQELGGLEPGYSELHVPAAVLAGAHDRLTPAESHAVPLAAALPQARLHLFPDGGHQLHWTHPAEVVRAVADVLAEAPASATPAPLVPVPRR